MTCGQRPGLQPSFQHILTLRGRFGAAFVDGTNTKLLIPEAKTSVNEELEAFGCSERGRDIVDYLQEDRSREVCQGDGRLGGLLLLCACVRVCVCVSVIVCMCV
jgi:hypothetical protein